MKSTKPHPRIDAFDELTHLDQAEAGDFHMPAEWATLARVWVTRPHNDETWPNCLPEAQQQWDLWIEAMRPFVEVADTRQLGIDTNDSWIRDYGPIFVKANDADGTSAAGTKALHDFHFNGWGGKYETRDLDDTAPQHIARQLNLPLWLHDMTLEGGSIEVNGQGTVMTTEQCLLNPNRNPHLSREQIIAELHQALGTRHVIWLPGGIIGDDTDGHIDDIARFVNPTTVLAIRAEHGHPDFEVLDRNRQALTAARDQDGRQLEIIDLPVPEPILYNFPADRFGPGGVNPVPASYANFLIANKAVFVPVFAQKTDQRALDIIAAAMPKHTVVPIRAEFLVVGLGALHCLSQQEPA